MVVHKSRGAARHDKSRKRVQLGGRIVRLLIGKEKREFSVHEDQLCSGSLYFRNYLQLGRKDVEGDCSICTESLSSHKKNLAWCKACGNNAHKACIKEWTNRQVTCPMCRAPWAMSKVLDTFEFGNLKPEAFDAYVQWLYTGMIPGYEEDVMVGRRFIRLLNLHMLGEEVQDSSFVNDIKCGFVTEILKFGMRPKTLETIYRMPTSPALRKFLLFIFKIQGDCGTEWVKKVPRAIVDDMAEMFLEKVPGMKEGDDIWTQLTKTGYLDKVETSEGEGAGAND